MKKIYVFIIVIIIIILLFIGIKEYKKRNEDGRKAFEYTKIQETISNDEKINPNSKIIFRTDYLKCEHINTEIQEISNELVNLGENELKEKYKDWKLEKFSPDEIILEKEIDGFCNQHYVLREENEYVRVNKLNNKGEEEYYLSTDIVVYYLPETDQINIKNGIKIYGKEKLIEVLQDFE